MQRISLTSPLLLCLDGACFAEGRDPLLAHREVRVERVARVREGCVLTFVLLIILIGFLLLLRRSKCRDC